MVIRATEVFTPNDFPAHTYVNRVDDRLEERLRNALETPKTVVSISGPSKSGKTVLVERIIGKDNLIVVSGAEIEKPHDLWDRVLDWMNTPSSVAVQDQTVHANTYSGKATGSSSIPLVVQGGAEIGYQRATSAASIMTTTQQRSGLTQVVTEIANSTFAVLVDDFHYMARSLQTEAAKQIKTAAERGVRICVASVPHRSDDVVRSNPELRGRTTNIDLNFWSTDELVKIAITGFRKLLTVVDDKVIERFARESCGSPQIMQAICLQACFKMGVKIQASTLTNSAIQGAMLDEVLEETSMRSDYSSLIEDMHQGPKTKGTERKTFKFSDGSKGDVYRAILLALRIDPPSMTMPYPELMERVKKVCIDDVPVGRSITETCDRMVKFAVSKYPNQRIVEFDGEGGSDTFSIVDPYWMFYLRSSTKIASLGESGMTITEGE